MTHPINILLLCRNTIVREGLSRILADRDFRVTQSSSNAAILGAVDYAEQDGAASLMLIDNGAEDCDAETLSALQQRFPQSHLVMLSDRFDFQVMLKAYRLGVRAYIVKEISCDRLAGTLQLVAMGEKVLPSQLADELQSRPGLAEAPDTEKTAEAACLSARELEILRWLIMGCPNKVISRYMDISEATVKVHVKAVLRKLNVKNRTQAAIWAANHGMRGRCSDVEPIEADGIPRLARLPAPTAMNGHLLHA